MNVFIALKGSRFWFLLNALVDSSKELDEFDGFSEVSEGDVSCLIYMAQDMSDVSISTVSSVDSEDPILSDVDIEQQLHNDSTVFIQSFDDNIFDNVDCSDSNCSDGEVESEEKKLEKKYDKNQKKTRVKVMWLTRVKLTEPKLSKRVVGNHVKKCHSKIGQIEREAIVHEFWGTGSYEKAQRIYLKYDKRCSSPMGSK